MDADVEHNNEAGEFKIFYGDVANVSRPPRLTFKTPENTVNLVIPNLMFVRVDENNSTFTSEYTFGASNEGYIRLTFVGPPAIPYGSLFVNYGPLNIDFMPISQIGFYGLLGAFDDALRAEAARQAKLKGRNVATLKKTLLAPVSAATSSKAANTLKVAGLGNLVGSFLSGKSGSLNQQVAALKTNAGVPNARRRKTRRRRN